MNADITNQQNMHSNLAIKTADDIAKSKLSAFQELRDQKAEYMNSVHELQLDFQKLNKRLETKFEETRAIVKRLEFDYEVNDFLRNIFVFRDKTNSDIKEI